jgi:hypothetical protein
MLIEDGITRRDGFSNKPDFLGRVNNSHPKVSPNMRRTARCTNCSWVGARTMHVGWIGSVLQWEEFPTDQDDGPSDLFSG